MKIIQEAKSDILGYCKDIGYVVVPKDKYKQDEVLFISSAKFRTLDGKWIFLDFDNPSPEMVYWSSLKDVKTEILNRREKCAV